MPAHTLPLPSATHSPGYPQPCGPSLKTQPHPRFPVPLKFCEWEMEGEIAGFLGGGGRTITYPQTHDLSPPHGFWMPLPPPHRWLFPAWTPHAYYSRTGRLDLQPFVEPAFIYSPAGFPRLVVTSLWIVGSLPPYLAGTPVQPCPSLDLTCRYLFCCPYLAFDS